MIAVLDEVFQDYSKLVTTVMSSPWRYGWISSTEVPDKFFNCNLFEAGKRDVMSKYYWEIFHELKQRLPIQNLQLLRAYANLQTLSNQGYPHTDAKVPGTLTAVIYICPETWNINWGGETVVYEGTEIVKSVVPKQNRVFLFPGDVVHQARSITPQCPHPRVTLMYKMKVIENV
jgi:2OG-Fe(II) oxygenase superfamily